MNIKKLIGLLLITATTQVAAGATPALDTYRHQGAGPFSAETGRQLWLSANQPQAGEGERSCSDCHGANLDRPGKHLRTGKVIAPMNPAITPQRLTDTEKIEKWFMRNCKWTFGRECTAQEKGDLILFIQQPNS